MPDCSTERSARAWHPTIVAISWIRALVSLALVDAERRILSLALTQGCEETWMLAAMFLCWRKLWVEVRMLRVMRVKARGRAAVVKSRQYESCLLSFFRVMPRS